jgi:hypothetical protein
MNKTRRSDSSIRFSIRLVVANILMTFADLMRQVKKADQLFAVSTKLSGSTDLTCAFGDVVRHGKDLLRLLV